MTQFDLIVLALLLISAIVGFIRGAVREIAALVALVAAAALAVFGLPLFAPFLRGVVGSGWIGAGATLLVVFAVTYVVLRLIGAGLARRIQQARVLGALDRSVGLAIGLGRGLAVLGVLTLMFNAATPPELKPRWITGAASWPLAQNMARLLTSLAPRGIDLAGKLKPTFDRAAQDGARDRTATDGYDARELGEMDDLVEKSR